MEMKSQTRKCDDGNVEPVPPRHGVERREDLLVGQIARGAEEYEGIGFGYCHLTSRFQFAPQGLQFFHQFERQCDAGQIEFKVSFQTQRKARTAQCGAGEVPFTRFGFDDAEHTFLDEFHDVPLVDRAHAAQVLDREQSGLLEYCAGQCLIFR